MANGERFNVVARRTAAMRRLSDCDRREAAARASNVIGLARFAPFRDQVRIREAEQAVRIILPEVTA